MLLVSRRSRGWLLGHTRLLNAQRFYRSHGFSLRCHSGNGSPVPTKTPIPGRYRVPLDGCADRYHAMASTPPHGSGSMTPILDDGLHWPAPGEPGADTSSASPFAIGLQWHRLRSRQSHHALAEPIRGHPPHRPTATDAQDPPPESTT